MKGVIVDSEPSLTRWVSQVTGIDQTGVKVRFRGNDLHILCEGQEIPKRWRTLSQLIQALQQTNLDSLIPEDKHRVYQIFIYGRQTGKKLPDWCQRLYLNQLERHLEQVHQSYSSQDLEETKASGGALIVPNETLARQGHPEAIARYLSETLSVLGVAVKVKKKTKKTSNSEESRLWIFCESSYSPDPSLIAETAAQKLRDLKLSGFRDAAIVSQVSGENTPDWVLRVDLTPPEVMLKEWARWGDLQALTRLLNQALQAVNIEVQTSIKESSLHLICTGISIIHEITFPDKALCIEKLTNLLESLAPQGIHAATVYGQIPNQDTPAWVEWLPLPASQHSDLSTSALGLAREGDEPAINFLLSRLLNPDLDWRLRTGGVRVLLVRKNDLLHVMCDAPVCPPQKPVASKVTKFIRQLKIAELGGVRVYGRRSGNKQPFWSYGVDFTPRKRFVPEATPEFAATSAYVEELLPSDSTEPGIRPDLTSAQVLSQWGTATRKFLLKTQLFLEGDQTSGQSLEYQRIPVAMIWGALGLLLTIQADWVLSKIVARTIPNNEAAINLPANSPAVTGNNSPQQTPTSANSRLYQNRTTGATVFNASGFTAEGQNQPRQKATATAILLAARSQLPTFNSRQLDEQLALYRQRLQEKGSPPDVLIIGSSRALRGVDPVALSQALSTQGYPHLDVFNFGVNGATAQVVDFIIRRLLTPSELPKLIIWADGSRAFNSGREDITFNAIEVSPGYKHLLSSLPTNNPATATAQTTEPSPNDNQQQAGTSLTASYQGVNDWLNQTLAGISATYKQREQLKTLVNQSIESLPLINSTQQTLTTQNQTTQGDVEEEATLYSVDFDGFLALSVRFDPKTYYKQHPKVYGEYDTDYKEFSLNGKQNVATQALLEYTQSQGIPLVFVNTPLTQVYLDAARQKYEQKFQQYMLDFATRPGFIFRDLSLLFPQEHGNFSDPSHLNRYGAYEVSKKLATDPMIPWPAK
ncbi:MAG: DUF1574 domain-containing protein [Nostocaceae cyanobacterium]|nr:DUF1574 domain-containing protein [Nostocaceae cyanobacterium]